MKDYYKLNESEIRTESAEIKRGIDSIIIEELHAETKCIIYVSDHES